MVGVFLTAILFALAGVLGGACHCVIPTTVFFPYAAIVLGRFSAESIGLLLIAIQFPLYAVVLAIVNGWERKKVVFLLLLAFHVAATLVSLKLHEH